MGLGNATAEGLKASCRSTVVSREQGGPSPDGGQMREFQEEKLRLAQGDTRVHFRAGVSGAV